MPARCLNKVLLIGNLTRDPELRYTPSGSAVCSFGLATNRYWATDTGEQKEDTQFHRIVAWNKLAEICSQLLGKGDKVYIEGRLQTREWTGADEVARKTTEIVISDMILLRSQRGREDEEAVGLKEPKGEVEEVGTPAEGALEVQAPSKEEAVVEKVGEKKAKKGKGEGGEGTTKAAGTAVTGDTTAKTNDDQEKEEKVEIPEDKTPF
jgi:single-strand DNA-binding protein